MDNNKYLSIKSDIHAIRNHIIKHNWDNILLQVNSIFANNYSSKYSTNNNNNFVNAVTRLNKLNNNDKTITLNIIKKLYSHYNHRHNNTNKLMQNGGFSFNFADALKNAAQKELTNQANQLKQVAQQELTNQANLLKQQAQLVAQEQLNQLGQQAIQNTSNWLGTTTQPPIQSPIQPPIQSPIQSQIDLASQQQIGLPAQSNPLVEQCKVLLAQGALV